MREPAPLAGPGGWLPWQQTLFSLATVGVSLAARGLLQPLLGERPPFLPLFGALLLLALLVRTGPLLAGAAFGATIVAWQMSGSGDGIDVALIAAATALAAAAAWLSAGLQTRCRDALRQAREQREALRVTLASIGDAVITTDEQGHVAFMNEVACRVTGWSADDARGVPLPEVFRIVDEDSGQALDNPVAEVLRLGEVAGPGRRTQLLRRDGSECPIDDSAAPIRAADGRITGAVLVFRDVTARRAAERAVAESEQRFRSMADGAPVLIWLGDGARQRSWFNLTWLKFTGRALAEETGSGWTQGVHPDDLERCVEQAAAAIAAQQPYTREFRLRRHDGAWRWLLDTGTPRFGADGRFEGHVGSAVDITDRKDGEAALARSEALFRRIADANLIGVGFADSRGQVSYLNDEMLRLMGRSRGDFEAGLVDLRSSMAPEFAAANELLAERLRSEGAVGGYQRAFLRPDGARTPFLGSAALLEPDSDVHVSIALDLTPLQRAEQARAALVAQLRDADRRKDEFLATLAHELRNPLAPMANSLAILRRSDVDAAAQARARATIERQLQHMVRLIDDLLDVSRITLDRLELRPLRVALSEVLDQALETCRPTLLHAGQTVSVALPGPPVWLQADPVRLAQVFCNLIGNASKYSPPGGPVTLAVRPAGGWVDIAVADHGVGIERELLPHVFEMFTRGEQPQGRTPSGLGIGLALARRLVELHGGELRAHSDGIGKGSEFVVRLPLAAAPPAAPPAVEPAPDAPAQAAPVPAAPAGAELAGTEQQAGSPQAAAAPPARRILVVDDNHDAAATMALLLELSGHLTRSAHDGHEALAVAHEFRPDAVLLDIGLPLLGGHEVARRLRGQPEHRNTVLVAVTGWGQQLDRQASKDAGFDAHLVKPVDHEALLKLLDELLSRRAAGP